MIAGRFSVPFRPHLFTKPKPTVLHLTQTALAEDEIFLILVFIYSEAKRQDETVRLYIFYSGAMFGSCGVFFT